MSEQTQEPKCPHCGYKFRDVWEWPDSMGNDGDDECSECGGLYRYETECIRYFRVWKAAPAKEPSHDD